MIEERDILEQELGYALQDQREEPESIQVASVGKMSGLIGQLWKGRKTKTQDIVDRYRDKGGKTKAPTRDQLDTILGGTEASGEGAPPPNAPPQKKKGPLDLTPEDVVGQVQDEYQRTEVPTEKRTAERNINVERHHEGAAANPDLANMDPDVAMENMETADDIARLLDASAKVQNLGEGPRTHAEIASRTDTVAKAREELRTVFEADPETIGALTDVQLHAGRRMLTTLGEQTVGLANRISGGDQTPQTLLEYQKKTEAFVALHSFMQGKVKEAARALSQQRMIAKTLDGHDVNDIADFIELGTAYRTPEDVAIHAANTARKAKKLGTSEAMVDATKPDARDYWKAGVEYWANNILSGVETHVVNLTSSPLVGLYEGLIVNNLAAALGKGRLAIGKGAPERVGSQEQVARMIGASIGLRDGLTAFWKTLAEGQAQFGPEKGEEIRGAMNKVFGYHGEQMGQVVPGMNPKVGRKAGETAADAMTLAFRGLSAGDSLWKTNVFRSEYTALVAREAYEKKVEDVGKYIEGALENPENHVEAYNGAMERSRRYTFTDTDRPGFLGDVARSTKSLASKHPHIKFFIPFIDTPINLIHYAMENSALAPLSQRLRDDFAAGGAKADIAAARVISGLGLTAVAYDMTSDEGYINTLFGAKLVGEGPDSFSEQKIREMTGELTNSIFINDKYYQVDRLDPFAMTVFSVVNTLEKARFAKAEWGFVDGLVKVALEIASHATNATYAKGVNDAINVMQGRKDVDKWIAGFASGFIPYSGTLRTVKKAMDPQPRKILDDKKYETTLKDIVDQKVASGTPGYSQDMAPARNWDGSLVFPRNGKPVHKMNIFDMVEETVSPVKAVKGRKNDPATNELIKNGLGPQMPEPVVSINGISFSLLSLDNETGLLYDAYAVEVGEARREAIEMLIKNQKYKALDAGYDSEQRLKLSSALSKGKRIGFGRFLEKDIKPFLERHPDKATELAKMFGGLGIKDILRLAKEDRLRADLQEKFRVRGVSERGALPVPPHIEEQVLESIPEF